MTTYYSPGCKNDKAHCCDTCEEDDGRPTLYWKEDDFDLCYFCLERLYKENVLHPQEPSIIIQRKFIKEDLRNKIYQRDGHKCKICGSIEKLCLDHVVPFSAGGKTEENNLQTLCKKCNSRKRDNN